MPLVVKGMAEMIRAFDHSGPAMKRSLRRAFLSVAVPIKDDIQSLSVDYLPNIGAKYSRMRIGVTQKSVYVVPVQKGVRDRGSPLARPNFATGVGRAMEDALEHNGENVQEAMELAFDRVEEEWSV